MYRNEEEVRRTARRTWGLYLLILAGWVVAVLLLALLGALVCSAVTWYESSPIYHLMSWVRDYIVFVCVATVLIGWIVISYLFIGRLVRDTQMVLFGAEQLAQPGQAPIRLPASLKSLEDQLNLVRERALRDAQTAREAEQRKNDLVVYLAHDLKTPLTSVIGYLTLLRDEPDLSAETRARYTGIVLDKAERLEDLINEFFDITRFNLSHLELEFREVDLKRMLEQVASEFSPALREKRITCELDLSAPLPAVCDPDKMARVFDNLLNNACHYAYPDSTLQVAGHQEGERIILTFRNAGRTIPPEKLERMFEQFFRLDSSRGTSSGNAGLGLAIAKEIVEAHGGTIYARSADEQVTFTVILPVEGGV